MISKKSAPSSTKDSSFFSEEDLNTNIESMNKKCSSSDWPSLSWWKKRTRQRLCKLLFYFNLSWSNFERILKELYHKNEVLEAQKAVLEELKRSIEHQRDQIEAEYKEVLLDKRGFPKNVVLIYTDIFENQKKDDKKAKDQEEWLKDRNLLPILILNYSFFQWPPY